MCVYIYIYIYIKAVTSYIHIKVPSGRGGGARRRGSGESLTRLLSRAPALIGWSNSNFSNLCFRTSLETNT